MNQNHNYLSKKSGKYYLVPVLLFHNVDGIGPYSLNRKELREYLDILREEKIQIVSLKNLYEHAVNQKFYDKPTMVLTIDDNYVNIVRVFAPILREYGYLATFFFYTKDIHSNPSKGTSWEDLKRLLKEGFDIQNHSYSHTVFHNKNREKIIKEVYDSREILEKFLNHRIWAFAYPMGYYTEVLNQELLQNGYKVVLTTDAKPLDLSKKFEGIIHRYTIQKKYVKNPLKMLYLQISYAKQKYPLTHVSHQ
ncbi:MAG: polysaccharide deacetylase family protein [Leptonema sp. (in: bacteria)]